MAEMSVTKALTIIADLANSMDPDMLAAHVARLDRDQVQRALINIEAMTDGKDLEFWQTLRDGWRPSV